MNVIVLIIVGIVTPWGDIVVANMRAGYLMLGSLRVIHSPK